VTEGNTPGVFHFAWPNEKKHSTLLYEPKDAAERVIIGSLMAELWYLFVDHIADYEPRLENKAIADAVKNAERWRGWAGLHVNAYSTIEAPLRD